MGSSGGSSTSQYTEKGPLYGAQARNILALQDGAYQNYLAGGPQYFKGSTLAAPNENQLQAQQRTLDYAGGVGQNLVSNAQAANDYWVNPENLYNFNQAPGYQGVRQGIVNTTTQNLTENQLPLLRGDSIINGTYGGTAQGVGEALATARTNDSIANQLSQMDLSMYGQNLQANQNAIARSGDMFNLGLAPGATQGAVGEQQQQQEQASIDDAMKRWNFEQMQPLMNLQTLQSLTGTVGQYGDQGMAVGNSGGGGGSDGTMAAIGTMLMLVAMMY